MEILILSSIYYWAVKVFSIYDSFYFLFKASFFRDLVIRSSSFPYNVFEGFVMMDWKLLHLLYTKNVGLYSFFHFLKKNQIILVGLNPTTYTLKKKCWLMGLMKS